MLPTLTLAAHNVVDAAVGGIVPMWDIASFLDNSKKTLIIIGGSVIILIGVVMVIVGTVKLASALISHGKKQVSYPVIALLIIIGGAFMGGGWTLMQKVAGGAHTTILQLGGDSSGGTATQTSTLDDKN